MSEQMKVTETCPCGARLQLECDNIYGRARHEAWMAAHAKCRAADHSTSDARYRQLRTMVATIGAWSGLKSRDLDKLNDLFPDLAAGGEEGGGDER